MRNSITRFSVLGVLALATACDGATLLNPSAQTAQIRIINATDIADVRVRLVGTSNFLVQDLDFRGVTQTCIDVPVGEQAFVFTSGDIELTTAIGTIEAGAKYSAFLVSSGATRRAVILADDAVASTGNNALRFINGTTQSGDVYVTTPGGTVGPSFLAYGGMGALATGNAMPEHVHRAIEHTQVRLFDAGTTTSPRADITLASLSNRVGTVVFTEAGTGASAGPTAWLVTPCS